MYGICRWIAGSVNIWHKCQFVDKAAINSVLIFIRGVISHWQKSDSLQHIQYPSPTQYPTHTHNCNPVTNTINTGPSTHSSESLLQSICSDGIQSLHNLVRHPSNG